MKDSYDTYERDFWGWMSAYTWTVGYVRLCSIESLARVSTYGYVTVEWYLPFESYTTRYGSRVIGLVKITSRANHCVNVTVLQECPHKNYGTLGDYGI